ncbi:MAG: bifunctional UDP-N-acetylglucosamine diphosphorylase/glucosamine-1-phosphate N-acetyltransferase GlmU, partial [Gammaproteobacteria bacterium]
MMNWQALILAAGKGTRMKSRRPKVLHPLAGRAMLQHVVDTVTHLGMRDNVVVIGHGAEMIQKALKGNDLKWVWQSEQLGTGHAAQQAIPELHDEGYVLIVYGDVPLIRSATLQAFFEVCQEVDLGVLTVELENPTGYGRILKNDNGHVCAIVEEKDANDEQKRIREINTGIYVVKSVLLKQLLSQLTNQNAQQEYLLTDIVALAAQAGCVLRSYSIDDPMEVSGVNDRVQLAELEQYYQHRYRQDLMRNGLTLMHPDSVTIRGELIHGMDVCVDANVLMEGRVILGDNVTIGPHCVLMDVEIAAGATIEAFSHLQGARIGENCRIGPYARIRPGTQLASEAKVGNFVELKKASVGENSKINHLSYIGDAIIGAGVNVGAGVITCNYDGVKKSETCIEDNAFVGSNTALVAPVTIGEGATIGAGSTITHSAPARRLTLSRTPQYTH